MEEIDNEINPEIDVKKISEILVDEINCLKEYNYEDTTCLSDEIHENVVRGLACSRKELQRNRYHCTHGWFIRCSWIKKVDILKRLAWETNNLYTNLHIMNTIYSATCKDWIYSSCQGLHLFKCDVILNDHHRCLDEEVLEDVIADLVQWYRTLDEIKQYNLIMDLMQLSGCCIIGKIFYEYLKIFKSRFREVIMDKIKKENLLQKKIEQNAKKGKKKIKPKKEDELEIQRQKQQLELDEIMKYLNKDFPDDSEDPDAIQLVYLLKYWNAFMVAYNKKTGIVVNPKKPNKKDTGGKKDKISKDLPDEIQLLPIWINKPLIASIDPKTFKTVKNVNKYWSFIVTGIKADVKCRQALNKTCAKLKSGLKICNVEKKITDHQLDPRFTRISNVTDYAHRQYIQSAYNAKTTYTLIADLYKVGTTFNVCGTNLEMFPRFTYAYKLDRLV